jgi:hypothetical protein
MRPARQQKRQGDGFDGKQAPKSPVHRKDKSLVNYGYEDHEVTSHASQRMSPKVLLADSYGTKINLEGVDDVLEAGNKSQNEYGKSNQDNSYTQNYPGLDLSGIDPDTMFQGNLLPSSFYQRGKNSKTMTRRHSNIEKIRKSARNSAISQISGSTPKTAKAKAGVTSSSSKQYKTLKQFLDEMFTEQFV